MNTLEIGGYLPLELSIRDNYLHKDGFFVNSGRHALEFVLKSINDINILWVPYYTCRVVISIIEKLGIKFSLYHINEDFKIQSDIHLSNSDYILYTNYFGVQDKYIIELYGLYGNRLIIDNAQSLFSKPIKGLNTFYSPRKMIGIADGGIAYVNSGSLYDSLDIDISYERSNYLLSRYDYDAQYGYSLSKISNQSLEFQNLKKMSNLTKSIYSSANFEEIYVKRRENFFYLHSFLETHNHLKFCDCQDIVCPLFYPFYCLKHGLRDYLIMNNIYIPIFWSYVINSFPETFIEVQLAKNIIALPIDQRYGENEMKYIINLIMQFNNEKF